MIVHPIIEAHKDEPIGVRKREGEIVLGEQVVPDSPGAEEHFSDQVVVCGEERMLGFGEWGSTTLNGWNGSYSG